MFTLPRQIFPPEFSTVGGGFGGLFLGDSEKGFLSCEKRGELVSCVILSCIFFGVRKAKGGCKEINQGSEMETITSNIDPRQMIPKKNPVNVNHKRKPSRHFQNSKKTNKIVSQAELFYPFLSTPSQEIEYRKQGPREEWKVQRSSKQLCGSKVKRRREKNRGQSRYPKSVKFKKSYRTRNETTLVEELSHKLQSFTKLHQKPPAG